MSVKAPFIYLCSFIVALCVLSSCGADNTKAPDTSGIKISLQTYRFDKDMYAIDTNHIGDGLKQLEAKYPDFLNLFLDTMMTWGVHRNFSDTAKAVRESVHEYLTYKDFVLLQDSVVRYYPDTKDIDAQLTEGFKLVKYYLPFVKVPKIYYVNGCLFNSPTRAIDSNASNICLDMFLGPQFPFYASVGVPNYMAPHLRKNYIPVALLRTTYQAIYPFRYEDRTLLDLMIERGKEEYFLHKVLPNTPDSVLFGFTNRQVKWCETNEVELYNFFVQNSLLYNKQEVNVMPYVVDGPFAKGIGTATDPGNPTPGNVGTWMGYRIVQAYMAQNPKIALKDLLSHHSDPAQFLDSARYKPR